MKHRILNLMAAGAVLAAGIWAVIPTAQATPDYAKKEKKGCTFCHPSAAETKALTEAGNYYKEHDHSLVGYVAKDDGKKK